MENNVPFSDEQTQYLAGFMAATGIMKATGGMGLPVLNNKKQVATCSGPESIHIEAQDKFTQAGKKLSKEEQGKRDLNPLDMWDQMIKNARDNKYPSGIDVFRYKLRGLFFVSPAQKSFMCRLRFAGGVVNTHQFRGVADLAEKWGGGYTHVTTRSNLQIREIEAPDGVNVLMGLESLGIVNRGAGGDNVRNITASPTTGIDPQELIDTRPLTQQLHYHILNHRELFNLPRKFNIAYDGGGQVTALADTNDVGFAAVRVVEGDDKIEPGVYFRLQLGGITGHQDFARDTGFMVKPEDTVKVSDAILRVFIAYGDRTDRKKARLKYLLDDWGFEKFLGEVKQYLSDELIEYSIKKCEHAKPAIPFAHIGVHAQQQAGKNYVGVVLPVGKLTIEQMHALADVADEFGSGTIRLTVWQNLLISDIDDTNVDAACERIKAIGLDVSTTNVRAGLVACTGNAGCKFAASNTKSHAMQIAEHIENTLTLDHPLNIHLTGCHHSCAQHYIGDIGLLGTKVEVGNDMVEGYTVYLGGGFSEHQRIAEKFKANVPFEEVPGLIENILNVYLENRADDSETFTTFTRRCSNEEISELMQAKTALPC